MENGIPQQAAQAAATPVPASAPESGTSAGAERRCAVTRAVLPKTDLIRFVSDPDGVIVADLGGKLPGRGVWIACRRHTVDLAVKRNVFAKSLRAKVNISPEMGSEVEALLAARARNALSLANKAGLVLSGFTKVSTAIANDRLTALVHATDAAEDGVSKLDRLYRAVASATGQTALSLKILNIDEMSLALGRPNVVHAAIRTGGAGVSFTNAALRLGQYRSTDTVTRSAVPAGRQIPESEEVESHGFRPLDVEGDV